jgi:predicted methyltransferase MtxX (methanogen marker protein 4)
MATKKLSLFPTILKMAKKKRRTIGISILKTNPEITKSLKKAKSVADIVVYGAKIPGFKNVSGKGMELGIQLIQDFKNGKIDQLVRGQVDDLGLVEEAKKLFGIDKNLRRIDLALVHDDFGREWFLTGASNPDLQTLEEKIRVSTELSKWLAETFKIKPKIAVMATCRPGSYGKDPVMTQTFEEAEATVKHLKSLGYTAENVHIEIERAMEFANLVLPARGTIGNQIFRAIAYLSKGQILASPTIFPGKLVYEDNSRNEQDYYPHIIFAAALANMKK